MGHRKRRFFLLELPSLQDWPSKLLLPSKYFILFLACDAKGKTNRLLKQTGRKAIRQGMRAACTWGRDCERVHDRIDDACKGLVSERKDESVIMTSWHSRESLREALWYFLYCGFAARRYSRWCKSWLTVIVGSRRNAEKATRYMRSQGCKVHHLMP